MLEIPESNFINIEHLIKNNLISSINDDTNRNLIYLKTTKSPEYTPNSPISISSNTQFSSLGFSGSGTISDPYLIDGLNITASSGDLINISNTTVFFRIRNNNLDGLSKAFSGISLYNVSHATIESNTIVNNSNDGITMDSTYNNTITNNTIINNNNGIKIDNSSFNVIDNSRIYSNRRIGIIIVKSHNFTLSNNDIHDNLINGILQRKSVTQHFLVMKYTTIDMENIFSAIYYLKIPLIILLQTI